MSLNSPDRPDPCAIVIFGASGDLTHRKLLPALWNFFVEGRLPEGVSIISAARSDNTDEGFREQARQAVVEHSRFKQPEADAWERFASGLFYHRGRYDDPDSYAALKTMLKKLCGERGSCGNTLFYLATPPSGYEEIVQQLGASGLTEEG